MCECEPDCPLSLSKRGIVFMPVEDTERRGRVVEYIQKSRAPSLAFVPSSQSPGIAVLVSSGSELKQ